MTDPSEKAARVLQDSLVAMPGFRRVTAPTRVLRALLLMTDGEMLLNGQRWEIKSENLNAGVYRVWLAPAK